MSFTMESPDIDSETVVRDPVCGMVVDPNAGKPLLEHAGHTYHFCREVCRDKFAADPELWLAGGPASEPMPAGTRYTCPMDPEIITDHPADCPVCGMALEPMVPSANAGPNPELVDFSHRFQVGLAFALPLVAIAMGPHAGVPIRDIFGQAQSNWIELEQLCSRKA